MRDADCQHTEGSRVRGGPSVVVLSPTPQVLGGCQAATMFRPGANRHELDIRWRRCPLVRVPSPARRGSAAECADMVPAGIDGGELTFGRVKLPVIISSPTGNATVNQDSAGKPIAGSNLLEARALGNIELTVIIVAPTLNATAIQQRTRVILTGCDLNEARRISLDSHRWSGSRGDGRRNCGGGLRHPRPKRRLLDYRLLPWGWRGRLGVGAGAEQQSRQSEYGADRVCDSPPRGCALLQVGIHAGVLV